MINMGVPVVSNRSVSNRGGFQATVLYANDQISLVKVDRQRCGLPALSLADYAVMRKTFCEQFSSIDPVERQRYTDKASDKREARRAAQIGEESPETVYDAEIRFWALQ